MFYKSGSRYVCMYVFVCVCVCVCVSVFLEKRSNWNYFSLPIFTFPIRRRRKDVTSVRLCNSVNSAPLCSLEVIMKMLITITTILTAFPKLIPAKCLVLISTKFINQGQSKANDETFLYFSDVYLHHKNQNDVCTFLLDIPLIKNS